MIRECFSSKIELQQNIILLNKKDTKESKKEEILKKIMFFFNSGQTLNTKEATDVFFGIVKELQTKDTKRLKIIILLIKELADMAENVMMANSSLVHIIDSFPDTFRKADAIRTLYKTSKGEMVSSLVKTLEKAISKEDEDIKTAALCSFIHLSFENKDLISKYYSEITNLFYNCTDSQHIAFWLLYLLKKEDHVFIVKLIQNTTKLSLMTPLTSLGLIQIFLKTFYNEPLKMNISEILPLLKYRQGLEMVSIETARAMISIHSIVRVDLSPVKVFLTTFIESNDTLRLVSALRTIEMLSLIEPMELFLFNKRLVSLLENKSAAVSSLSFSILLRTGNEQTLNALLKKMSSSMFTFSEELKYSILSFLDSLVLKYPERMDSVLKFFESLLLSSTAPELQQKIIGSIFFIVEKDPLKFDYCLPFLCQFIEDCGNSIITARIVSFIGEHSTENNLLLVRTLCNRVLLESDYVRSIAAEALFKLSNKTFSLKKDISCFFKQFLKEENSFSEEIQTYIFLMNSPNDFKQDETVPDLKFLEEVLVSYIEDNVQSVDLLTIPRTRSIELFYKPQKKQKTKTKSKIIEREFPFGLLNCFRSIEFERISEDNEEISVYYSKHIFEEGILLEFKCVNEVPEQTFKNISICIEDCSVINSSESIEELKEEKSFYILLPNVSLENFCYVLQPLISFSVFDVKEEISTEKYNLTSISIEVSDYMKQNDEDLIWEDFSEETEIKERVLLSELNEIKDAVEQIVFLFNGKPLNDSNFLYEDKTEHELVLSGTSFWRFNYFCYSNLKKTRKGIELSIKIRSSSFIFSQKIFELLS